MGWSAECDTSNTNYYSNGCFSPYDIDALEITTGLPERPTNACQYWMKGLPGVCKYWSDGDPGSCTYVGTDGNIPSAYNSTACDFLGRASWCDKYELGEAGEDLDEYRCVAPCIFRTGLGKQLESVDYPFLRAVLKSEVKGYNDGKCDGWGMGTGTESDAEPSDVPVKCNYYRPWHMGFGAVKPHELVDSRGISEADYERALEPLERWLPYNFRVYNIRSKVQKCQWWDKDVGSDFVMDYSGLYLEEEAEGDDVFDVDGKCTLCTNTDPKSFPYCTRDGSADVMWVLENVWSSQTNSVICNGAKPECPCYTGEWVYCNDDNMQNGMRITANQIMEVRFWLNNWASQEEYDKFFDIRPNPTDPSTSDIYTFTGWNRLGMTVSDSIMKGKRISMCQPSTIFNKRFVPEDYLTITDVIYPKAGTETGVKKPHQISFPNLIRDLEDLDILPLNIVYPYPYTDLYEEFANIACISEDRYDVCIKRSNRIGNDEISVFGSTIRNKTVYVFNSYFTGILKDIRNHPSIFTMSDTVKFAFFDIIEDFIKNAEKLYPDCVASSTSDSTGFFSAGPVKLKYQAVNELVICVNYGDNRWDFRKRKVWSQWYGGAAIQSSFNHSFDDGALNLLPGTFNGASATCDLVPLYGRNEYNCRSDVLDAFSVYSDYKPTSEGTFYYYAYCLKEVTVRNEETTRWTHFDNTKYIWAEVDSTELNYIFKWEFVNSKMVYNNDEDDPPCGGETEVEMELVYPSSSTEEISGSDVEGAMPAGNTTVTPFIDQKYIPPNVCILKPKDDNPRRFFKDDWKLYITYKYTKLDTNDDESENENIIYPSFSDTTTFRNSLANFSTENNIVTVSNIRSDTLSLMVYFSDEDGRLISTIATKLLTSVVELNCRNVEIYYSYTAAAKKYRLIPDSGLSTWRGPDTQMGEATDHYSIPKCGDHGKEGRHASGNILPMWFPYTACDNPEYYFEFTGAGFCFAPYGETPEDGNRTDYRYKAPVEYHAFAEANENWLATCKANWKYRYSRTVGDINWAGYCNIVAIITNLFEYKVNNWRVPPFGNKGREMVERWLSQDCEYHLSMMEDVTPYTKKQWMPLVMDNTSLFTSFNAFDDEYGLDCFAFTNQLNYYNSYTISEVVDENTRLRFDEIFNTRRLMWCSYPQTLVTVLGSQAAVFYSFKDDSHVWAWQEQWKDIEHIDSDEDRLGFVTFEKPGYLWDVYKTEHRLICEESEYLITFTPPEVENGEIKTYPSISLSNGEPRYFEIIYDEADYGLSDNVTWMDENMGKADASGGDEDEKNIYEETMGGNWIHDQNTIYDQDASKTVEEAEDAGRCITSEDDEKSYYNRGLIANIPKNRLLYLPYSEEISSINYTPTFSVQPAEGGNRPSWIWRETGLNEVTITMVYDSSICASEFYIRGSYGAQKIDNIVYLYCKPVITITGIFEDSSVVDLSYSSEYVIQSKVTSTLTDFEKLISIDVTPLRMITNRLVSLRINIETRNNQGVWVKQVRVKEAAYKRSFENIKVWERKYIPSKSSNLGDINLDGPENVLSFNPDFDNSGQYFPVGTNTSYIDSIAAIDKMRSIAAGEQHTEDEEVDVDISNLVSTESTEQQSLYLDAYSSDSYDEIKYVVSCPISFKDFLDELGTSFIGSIATFNSAKLTWDRNGLVQSYEAGEIWQPGGHKFEWDEETFKTRCWYLGLGAGRGGGYLGLKSYSVYDAKFIHVDTQEGALMNPAVSLRVGRLAFQIGVTGGFEEGMDITHLGIGSFLPTSSDNTKFY